MGRTCRISFLEYVITLYHILADVTLFMYVCACAVSGTFLNTLKFRVKDCDPATGEPDDDVGYDDEYVVSGR